MQSSYLLIDNRKYINSRNGKRKNIWDEFYIFSLPQKDLKRRLHMDLDTFVFILEEIKTHPIFSAIPNKEPKANMQLQLEVFLTYLGSPLYSYEIAKKFGIVKEL